MQEITQEDKLALKEHTHCKGFNMAVNTLIKGGNRDNWF